MKSKTTLPRTIVSALVGEAMGTRKQFVVLVTYLASLIAIVLRVEAGDTFVPSTIAPDGIALVGPRDTYYDGSDGQLAAALPLPLGASRLQFLVTGSVATDGSLQLASPDGITKEGWVLYNFTQTRWFRGTYQGVPIGATTGVDPALFGVFFSFDFAGAAPNSLNYRSDSGIRPDPRTLDVYTPELNQPFHIGDGATANNALISSDDSIIPAGVIQTFVIPMGATHLLLGIGADDLMSDNFGYNTSGLGFRVQVFEDYVGPDQAPVIHYQPAGGTFFVGESVRLSVTTSGSRPLSYAWFKDSIPVPGATDPALLIADAKVVDSGSYTATVSNEFGSVISEPAEVAITPRPWPYFEDFEATVGSEWSHRPTDTTPVGNRRFLGQFANDTVSLNLNDLPPHQAVTVSFDLYVIETWDGNGDPDGGPDIWSLSVAGGPTLLHTTFLISPWWGDAAKQAFPGDFPGTAYPARTGAVENDTLGYGWVGDAVYSLTFTFPHRADALRFDFSGQGLEGVADESWGLDNVQVSLTPADGSPHVRTSLGSGAVWTPATGGEVLRVRTSGDRALITFGDSRFQLIDLSDPNQPAALGTGKALLEISDVVLAGDYAYVSSWDVDFLSTVEIFDFRDPTAPILCGYYDMPG